MGLIDDVKNLVKPEQAKKPPTPTPQLSKKIVLVVDDDESIRQLYTEILTNEGYEVETAVNGKEGLDDLKERKPDLVLLDLMMPEMDGKTMLHALRQIPEFKTLPVIILTNAGDVDSMRETKLYYGADVFLIKSNITPQDIVSAVKNLI